MYPVIDVAEDTTRKLTQLKSLGVTGIIRYFDRFSAWKQVKVGEMRAIAAAHMEAGIVYEHAATPAGHDMGHADALYSRRIAPDLGVPTGAAVYFAVDYDPSQSEVNH